MYAACWASMNICSLHKGWFVNLSARLVTIDLAKNNLEELPEELFNILPVLEELDVSNNKLIFLPEINHLDSFTRYSTVHEYILIKLSKYSTLYIIFCHENPESEIPA
jgi:Leucine-rich repeat (LRR) protein